MTSLKLGVNVRHEKGGYKGMDDKWKLSCVIETLKHQLYRCGALCDEHDFAERILYPAIQQQTSYAGYSVSLMIDVAHRLQSLVCSYVLNKETPE